MEQPPSFKKASAGDAVARRHRLGGLTCDGWAKTVSRATQLEMSLLALTLAACSARPGPGSRPEPADAGPEAVAEASPPASPPDGGQVAPSPPEASPLAEAAEAGPPQPALPSGVVALPLQGFSPAALVAPDQSSPPPWPVLVVLHGNFDRPEWECTIWAAEGRKRGWLLCPRGSPRPDADPALDRWTYPNRATLSAEIRAGVAELARLYPGLVRDDGGVLIGFSLGAHMAPRLASSGALVLRGLVLGEGGYGVTPEVARSVARRGVGSVVYLCGGRTACPSLSRQAAGIWRSARVTTATVTMPGVGHWYAEDFDPFARQVFQLLGL